MKITIVFGGITKLKVDAIVNTANSTMLGGGGVDGMFKNYDLGSVALNALQEKVIKMK